MAAWVELLDEVEAIGPLMREVVRVALEDPQSDAATVWAASAAPQARRQDHPS